MKNDTTHVAPLDRHNQGHAFRVGKAAKVGGRRQFLSALCSFLTVILPFLPMTVASPSVLAQQDLTVGRSTGLPVPRFVSVDSSQSEVNVRFGPGQQYPINWVFTRPGVPLEVVAEFDNWRKIKDFEGAEGWISARLLSGQRTIMIQGTVRDIRRRADNRARVMLRAEPGVIGDLLECHDSWCRVEIEGQRGWLQRDDFWGTLPGELYP